MSARLPYGRGATLALEIDAERLVADWSAPRNEPLPDPLAATRAPLATPIGYPELRRAVVPGDRVTIALEDDVPEAVAIVVGVVEALVEGGVAPSHIGLLQSAHSARQLGEWRDALPAILAADVESLVHDATDRNGLAYLAATKEGSPIYVNRALADADLVVPIGCARFDDALDYFGVFGILSPGFADEACQKRARSISGDGKPSKDSVLNREADEVGWQLGIRLLVQVVPAGAGGVAQIVAGDVDALLPQLALACESAWSFSSPRRAGLAIVSIEGPQSWEAVGRALAAVEPVVQAKGGAVAILTELSEPPGAAIKLLANAENFEAVDAKLARQARPDTAVARQLARALARGPVYLLSQLESESIEELGLAPVAGPDEIVRLASRAESCLLLSNAQFARTAVRATLRSFKTAESHGKSRE